MMIPMRRHKRAISSEAAYELLHKGEYGILSTVNDNGQPYGVPLNYCVLNDRVYFHCAADGHKLSNLNGNPKASFCVVGDTELLPDKFSTKYESVIVFGITNEVTGDEKQAALEALIKKYSPNFHDEGLAYIKSSSSQTRLFGMSIDSITGKARR
ncbi:MAG: pyridoxamine 5'-phosphate oxidase family protein [Deltaproteobacteria bacterium]|nr:pyridoxamine 5'-phosphate oxidase family protein [Deltaproteobacteria bacterium]MBN2672032.1 pyridoxamine 5'-phosphate oxidase family protein [Deltaproteobacteria bacterium]